MTMREFISRRAAWWSKTAVASMALSSMTCALDEPQSAMATIKLRGWFKPQMAAQINQRDDGYYIGSGDKIPVVNGVAIPGPTRLNDGDVVELSGVRLNFIVRE